MIGLMVVALIGGLSLTGIAAANEGGEVAEGALATPRVVVDEENGLVFIGIPIVGELPECGPSTTDPATDESASAVYGAGDCIEFVIAHPPGKTHHGAIVSTVAKNLHPSMLDGIKKGEITRVVASGKGAGDAGGGVEKDKADKPDKFRDKPDKAERFRIKAERFRIKAERFRIKAEWFESRGDKFADKAEKFRAKADEFEAKAENLE